MADRGWITGGMLDGPLAFDHALARRAADTERISMRRRGARPDAAAMRNDFNPYRGHRYRCTHDRLMHDAPEGEPLAVLARGDPKFLVQSAQLAARPWHSGSKSSFFSAPRNLNSGRSRCRARSGFSSSIIGLTVPWASSDEQIGRDVEPPGELLREVLADGAPAVEDV